MKRWRLLVTRELRGPLNMAIDAAIARTVAAAASPPTLRFYDWRPYSISLGHNQKSSAIDFSCCKRMNFDVARRPTGGRAVLHAREFTYSVIFPVANAKSKTSITKTYFRLSEWLLDGLRMLGVDARRAAKPAGNPFARTPLEMSCFAIPLNNEIMVDGKKLVGSAQRQWPAAILQHGSILVGPEHLDVLNVVNEPQEILKQMEINLKDRTTCLEEHVDPVPDLCEFSELMADCWEKRFNTVVEKCDIAEEEWLLAESMTSEFDLLSAGIPGDAYDVPRSEPAGIGVGR